MGHINSKAYNKIVYPQLCGIESVGDPLKFCRAANVWAFKRTAYKYSNATMYTYASLYSNALDHCIRVYEFQEMRVCASTVVVHQSFDAVSGTYDKSLVTCTKYSHQCYRVRCTKVPRVHWFLWIFSLMSNRREVAMSFQNNAFYFIES